MSGTSAVNKFLCVLMELSLGGSSQTEKFGTFLKHVTHPVPHQLLPPIHFNEICLFCYKSQFDFWDMKCLPLPRRKCYILHVTTMFSSS